MFVIELLLALVFLACVVLGVAFTLVNSGRWATTLEENSMLVIQQGNSEEEGTLGDLHEIRLNSSRYRLLVPYDPEDRDGYEIVPKSQAVYRDDARFIFEETILEEKGFWWISWLWPYRRVMKLKISKDKLKPGYDLAAAGASDIPLEQKIAHREGEITNIRVEFPRPFLVKDIELADGNTVDVILYGDFYIRFPYKTFYKAKGDFFKVLEDLVAAHANRIFAKMAYERFLSEDKGDGSDIANELGELTHTSLDVVGIVCLKLYVKEQAPAGATKEFAASVRAQEKERLEAAGAVEKAKGEADAARTRAAGEADAIRARGKAEAERNREIRNSLGGSDEDQTTAALAGLLTAEQLAKLPNLQVLGSGVLPTIEVKKNAKNE